MMGPYTQTYLPMGDLVLTFDIPRDPARLKSATIAACWTWIAGSPACVIRLTSSIPGKCSSRNPIRSWSFASRQAARGRSVSRPGWVANSISGLRPGTNSGPSRQGPHTSTPATTIAPIPSFMPKPRTAKDEFRMPASCECDSGALTVKDNAITGRACRGCHALAFGCYQFQRLQPIAGPGQRSRPHRRGTAELCAQAVR